MADLLPVVRGFAKAGFRKPDDVSRLLNKNGWKTACGEPWSPRLTAFLLTYLFSGEGKATAKARPAPKVSRPPVAPANGVEAPKDMSEALSRLGRVTRR